MVSHTSNENTAIMAAPPSTPDFNIWNAVKDTGLFAGMALLLKALNDRLKLRLGDKSALQNAVQTQMEFIVNHTDRAIENWKAENMALNMRLTELDNLMGQTREEHIQNIADLKSEHKAEIHAIELRHQKELFEAREKLLTQEIKHTQEIGQMRLEIFQLQEENRQIKQGMLKRASDNTSHSGD